MQITKSEAVLMVFIYYLLLLLATACFSRSLPDLNFLDPYFIFMYMHNNHCHRVTAHLQSSIIIIIIIIIINKQTNCFYTQSLQPVTICWFNLRTSTAGGIIVSGDTCLCFIFWI